MHDVTRRVAACCGRSSHPAAADGGQVSPLVRPLPDAPKQPVPSRVRPRRGLRRPVPLTGVMYPSTAPRRRWSVRTWSSMSGGRNGRTGAVGASRSYSRRTSTSTSTGTWSVPRGWPDGRERRAARGAGPALRALWGPAGSARHRDRQLVRAERHRLLCQPCARCNELTDEPVVVSEVHQNSGPGFTVYACPTCAPHVPPPPDVFRLLPNAGAREAR